LQNSFNWLYVYFILLLKYLIKKSPAPMKRGTVSLIKVVSCNALLRMLLVCIRSSSLKSVLRYKFLVLGTYHLDTKECFINPSGISDVCSSGAKSHTGDESMSVKRVHIQVLNLCYKCSIYPPLVTRQTSIL
jgi:hypothetical protein